MLLSGMPRHTPRKIDPQAAGREQVDRAVQGQHVGFAIGAGAGRRAAVERFRGSDHAEVA